MKGTQRGTSDTGWEGEGYPEYGGVPGGVHQGG